MSVERLYELRNKITRYNYEYHVLDEPSISDLEYDKLFNELLELEKKYPKEFDPSSPVHKVGGEVLEYFRKVEHNEPMLSLSNAFSFQDLEVFDHRIRQSYPAIEYNVEMKIDGLAISLEYRNGKFYRAVTRGNGIEGEDVSHNIKVIDSIPLRLNKSIDVIVRGEVFMPHSSFINLNKERAENNEKTFANCRNAASGTIRQLDSTIVAQRSLDAFWYTIIDPEKHGVKTQSEALEYLKDLGFKTNPHSKILSEINEVFEYITWIDQNRYQLDYDIDGAVVKVNDFDIQRNLGYTVRVPRFAIAYKYQALEVESVVEDIFITVGRTGKITPNAKLKPVEISGSTVSYATLHNYDYIKNKDIRVNDVVKVRKAGEIIPEIVSVDLSHRKASSRAYELPISCPQCHDELLQFVGEVDFYCVNTNCPAKIQESIIHFSSRAAMDIVGLGEKRVVQLHKVGLLNKIVDIYNLKNHYETLIQLEKMGEKSVRNLIEAIEISKSQSLDKALFGLGIRYVGAKTSQVLADAFKSIEAIMEADYEALLEIDEVGEVIARSVTSFFENEDNKKMIEDLQKLGVQFNYHNQKKDDTFEGMRFVLTGSLESMTRTEAKKLIESLGGKVTSSVSSKTSVLIYGNNAGSKIERANELGIPTWTETEFMEEVKK